METEGKREKGDPRGFGLKSAAGGRKTARENPCA